jgi:hypothetical protein
MRWTNSSFDAARLLQTKLLNTLGLNFCDDLLQGKERRNWGVLVSRTDLFCKPISHLRV